MCEKYFSITNTCKARVDQLLHGSCCMAAVMGVPEEFLGSGGHALEVPRQLQNIRCGYRLNDIQCTLCTLHKCAVPQKKLSKKRKFTKNNTGNSKNSVSYKS